MTTFSEFESYMASHAVRSPLSPQPRRGRASSAQRNAIATLRPSFQPSSRSHSTNADTHGLASDSVLEPKNPIVGSFAACCARAASGQIAVAPPSSVINSRRLMGPTPKSNDHGLSIAGLGAPHPDHAFRAARIPQRLVPVCYGPSDFRPNTT